MKKISSFKNRAKIAVDGWRKGGPPNDMANIIEEFINSKLEVKKGQDDAVEKALQNVQDPESLKDELYYIYDNPEDFISKDQEVLYCEDHQLQLDIDTEEDYKLFITRIHELKTILHHRIKCEEYFSTSGPPKRHIIVSFFHSWNKEPEILEKWYRITLQFLLGSDKVRETMNAYRVLLDVDNPVRLIKPKKEKIKEIRI